MIEEINYKDLTIYCTRYVHSKSIKMLSLYYDELMWKTEEHEGKRYLIVNDDMLDKIIDKIKETIGIVKFDGTRILIDTDDKLPDYITFKNVVILITCVIKSITKIYPQLFLEEILYNKWAKCKGFKKKIRKGKMSAAWHPKRWWNFCIPKDKKK